MAQKPCSWSARRSITRFGSRRTLLIRVPSVASSAGSSVIAASAGNHGQAVAWAAREAGILHVASADDHELTDVDREAAAKAAVRKSKKKKSKK